MKNITRFKFHENTDFTKYATAVTEKLGTRSWDEFEDMLLPEKVSWIQETMLGAATSEFGQFMPKKQKT